jgi:phage gp46-like protein
MTLVAPCRAAIAKDRRHTFWATQADCGSEPGICGEVCANPGLRLIKHEGGAASISTAGWITGLIINIFMTDGTREDVGCGIRPGQRGGHWSQAYRGDGNYNGSRIRQVPVKGRIEELVSLIEGYAQLELERLIRWGVATRVNAKAKYAGGNRVNVIATVIGELETVDVALNATRLTNSWAWTT